MAKPDFLDFGTRYCFDEVDEISVRHFITVVVKDSLMLKGKLWAGDEMSNDEDLSAENIFVKALMNLKPKPTQVIDDEANENHLMLIIIKEAEVLFHSHSNDGVGSQFVQFLAILIRTTEILHMKNPDGISRIISGAVYAFNKFARDRFIAFGGWDKFFSNSRNFIQVYQNCKVQ